jgi:hypothetical protein
MPPLARPKITAKNQVVRRRQKAQNISTETPDNGYCDAQPAMFLAAFSVLCSLCLAEFSTLLKPLSRIAMLELIAVVLVVLWLLGLVTSFTMGGLIHLLLVIAVIAILLRLISGRRI